MGFLVLGSIVYTHLTSLINQVNSRAGIKRIIVMYMMYLINLIHMIHMINMIHVIGVIDMKGLEPVGD